MMIAAALFLPFALMQADLSAAGEDRYARCLALVDEDAPRAYEEAMVWATDTNAVNAYRCAAVALLAQGRTEDGARRLESLATAVNPANASLRAELLSQAGNAWLLAREPGQARSAFTRAIVTMTPGATELPDLLIDRARAYAMEGDYRLAEEDLSAALDQRPGDALALRLRASARLNQRAFPLAEADALASLNASTTEDDRVGAALVLGHVRESARTGVVVEAQ
ncbi:MAG: hypothetical protein DCF16_03850 [Alphaproteobacteria bacterium]|nr:MAG: hypothetical protein DCF16_03850 [Alphaproteobacteria bacterium]